MCDSCSKLAVDVIHRDFYHEISQQRDEILDSEEVEEQYINAFEELIQNYSSFLQKVFDGHYTDEQLQARQAQWETRFEVLKTQIELYKKGELPEEEQAEPEPPLVATDGLRLSSKNIWTYSPQQQ